MVDFNGSSVGLTAMRRLLKVEDEDFDGDGDGDGDDDSLAFTKLVQYMGTEGKFPNHRFPSQIVIPKREKRELWTWILFIPYGIAFGVSIGLYIDMIFQTSIAAFRFNAPVALLFAILLGWKLRKAYRTQRLRSNNRYSAPLYFYALFAAFLFFILLSTFPYDYAVNPGGKNRENTYKEGGSQIHIFELKLIAIVMTWVMLFAVEWSSLQQSLDLLAEKSVYRYYRHNIITTDCDSIIHYQASSVDMRSDDQNLSFHKLWRLERIESDNFYLFVYETVLLGLMLTGDIVTFKVDGFLGPLDTCLAFEIALIWVIDSTIFAEGNKILHEVAAFNHCVVISDDLRYKISYDTLKVIVTAMTTLLASLVLKGM